jgi:hypothetical protein
VEQALRFGKHVLVEFPLAFEAHPCVSLFELARRQGLVLQVEFVGLLSQYHADVAAFITREQVAAARLDFSGRWYRWVAAEAQAARWGQLGLARLLTLKRWFGPLDLEDVHLTEHTRGYQLDVRLVSQNGIPIVFCDQRGVHLRRSQHLELTLAGGQRIAPERQRESHDLFARDLDRFIQQIDHPGQVEPYVCRDAIIQTTALAAAISRRAAALR